MAEETPPGDAYSIVLADLRAKRAQIDAAISAIEALSGAESQSHQQFAAPPQASNGGHVTAGMFHGLSIAEAVKQLLAMKKKPLGTAEITASIREGGVAFTTGTPANTVSSVLHRESGKTGAVISVGRGLWALPAWYPNPSRFQKRKPISSEPLGEEDRAPLQDDPPVAPPA